MIEIKEKPEVKIEVEVKILESEERQTIVHCSVSDDYAFRIWPSTFLIEQGTGKRASNNSVTRGRPPVISRVLPAARGILAII